ncbi:MAG: N-6 DNA methylase [Xanthobacteraceae bacterium]
MNTSSTASSPVRKASAAASSIRRARSCVMVEMIEPYKGRIYDPCCGSGGMFVQSENFALEHEGRDQRHRHIWPGSNYTTWRFLQDEPRCSRHRCRNQNGTAKAASTRTSYATLEPTTFLPTRLSTSPIRAAISCVKMCAGNGVPPASNANLAWIQHIVHHLAPSGTAGWCSQTAQCPQRKVEDTIRRADRRRRWGTGRCRLHDRTPGPAFLFDADTGLPLVSPGTNRTASLAMPSCATGATRSCLSMRDSATWWTARARNSLTPMSRRSHAPIMLGVAKPRARKYEDIPGFCKAATIEVRQQARLDARTLC